MTGTQRVASEVNVGVDVGQRELVVAVHGTAGTWSVPNELAGHRRLVERLRGVAPTRIVLEPTGGYERLVVGALAAAGLPVIVVNARQVRDFAKATGRSVKSVWAEALARAHMP